jgi:hypothetical protein
MTSIWLIDKSRNNSEIIFRVKYFNEESLFIEFRENMTYKARESNMFDSDLIYGNYKMNDSILVLSNSVRFGKAKLNDTLTISDQGIKFKLESTWRNANKGVLHNKHILNMNSIKNKLYFIALIITVMSCKDLKTKINPTINTKSASTIDSIQNSFERNSYSTLSDTSYLKSISLLNFDTGQFVSDTVSYGKIKLIVYGKLYKPAKQENRKNTSIYSVKVIEPLKATLKSMWGTGGYLLKENKYEFKDLIKVTDKNNDGKLDITIYDSNVSKGKNNFYVAFLRNGDTYKYSEEFSGSNIKYDSISKTYSSKIYNDFGGRNYLLRIYENHNDSLIKIGLETQRYLKTEEHYLRKSQNYKTGKIIEEVLTEKEVEEQITSDNSIFSEHRNFEN